MTRYRNARWIASWTGRGQSRSTSKRMELYREAERLIMEDAPLIPLSYLNYERLFQPYVQSVEVSALGDPYIPMRKIWLAK